LFVLLAEDLLLLLTDDATGKTVVDGTTLDLALAGAVLLELAAQERVEVAGPGEQVQKGRLTVRNGSPTGDPILDEALTRLAAKGPQKPASVLPRLTKMLRESLYNRLVARGILRFEQGRILGIFATRQWPAAEAAHETEVRRGLYDVLVVGREPAEREAMLVSLLQSVDALPKVIGGQGVDRKALRARGKAIAEGEFAGAAVRKAVEAVNAAVFTSITAATIVATGSS
jgi:hypothetical protein